MADLEMNLQEQNEAAGLQFSGCTCNNVKFGEFCENCMKYCEQPSELSSLPSMTMASNPVLAANLLMIVSIFLYSGNSIVIKKYVLMGGTGPGFLFLRSLVSIPFLALLTYGLKLDQRNPLMAFDENRRVNAVMLAGCVAGAIRQSLLPFIMENSEASTVGILSPSIPLVTAVFCHLFKIEKLTILTVACLLMSACGLIFGLDLIEKFNSGLKLTYHLLLMIPITKSLQVVFLKMASDSFEGLPLLRNQVVISIVVCLPGSILFSIVKSDSLSEAFRSLLVFDFKQLLCAVYAVLAILFVAWRIQIYCLKILGANAVSLFQTLRPFFTMMMGAFFLGEPITLRKAIGSLIVCAALVIYQKNRVRPGDQH